MKIGIIYKGYKRQHQHEGNTMKTLALIFALSSLSSAFAAEPCVHRRDVNVRFVSHPGKVQVVLRNLSTSCTYDVGVASYRMCADDYFSQVLNQHKRNELRPGAVTNVYVDSANCASQNDVFVGPVITDFHNG